MKNTFLIDILPDNDQQRTQALHHFLAQRHLHYHGLWIQQTHRLLLFYRRLNAKSLCLPKSISLLYHLYLPRLALTAAYGDCMQDCPYLLS